MKRKIFIGLLVITLLIGLVGCKSKNNTTSQTKNSNSKDTTELSKSNVFTDRDLDNNPDISNATKYTISDGKDITITEEGIYVISGSAKNSSIIVNTDKESKVQLVLKNLNITNDNTPCIYVKKADKVFVTTKGSNSLTVSGTFTSDQTTNTDAVIFSKEDLVLNGTGSLDISSTDNGVTSKDDLKVTGGTINISCSADALEANESVAIADGNITINSEKDGLHAEYDEDSSTGYVYIVGGTLNIKASDDAIHATTIIQIDGGDITTDSREGIEGTYIKINDGKINITASDDGINAGSKSTKYTVSVEINGGTISIDMGKGDTDAIDSNGNLYINGGTISINAQSPFDYDGDGELNDGNVTVNGNEITELTNQVNGGPGGGPRR